MLNSLLQESELKITETELRPLNAGINENYTKSELEYVDLRSLRKRLLIQLVEEQWQEYEV